MVFFVWVSLVTFALPEVRYLMAVHLPLLQGESPAIAIIRTDAESSRLIKVGEVRGRMFHENVMAELERIAGKMCEFDKTPSVYAHLAITGHVFGGGDVAELLAGKWPEESWSFVRLAGGADLPILETSDDRLPFNQFKIPRMAIVNTINLAYSDPGRIYFSLNEEEGEKLQSQLAAFSERTATLSANDPDAILEYEGEGLVIVAGVAMWHHFNSKSVRAGVARQTLIE